MSRAELPIRGVDSKLDELDLELLNSLIQDGRASWAELGRRCGISRATARDRIEHMIRIGVVEDFTVILDPVALGLGVSTFFEIDVEPAKVDDVAETLANRDEIVNIYLMTGPTTLHTHALVSDHEALERFMQWIYSIPGIVRVETHTILKRYKNRRGGLRL